MTITERPVDPASVGAPASAAASVSAAAPVPLLDLPPTRARDPRPGVSGVAPPELLGWFADRGQAAFRARQVADHVWSARATSFEEIHTLPGALRADLEAHFRFDTLVGTETREADGGLTDEGAPRPR